MRIIAGFNHKLVLLRGFYWCPVTKENLFKVLLGRRRGLAELVLVIDGAALE